MWACYLVVFAAISWRGRQASWDCFVITSRLSRWFFLLPCMLALYIHVYTLIWYNLLVGLKLRNLFQIYVIYWKSLGQCIYMHSTSVNCFAFSFIIIVRIWDVRPFAPADRQLKVLVGNQHGFEKVSLLLMCNCTTHLSTQCHHWGMKLVRLQGLAVNIFTQNI